MMSQLDELQVLMTKTRFRGLVTDVLEIFASFETNCSARRNSDFFSGTGISSDAAFAASAKHEMAVLHARLVKKPRVIGCQRAHDGSTLGDQIRGGVTGVIQHVQRKIRRQAKRVRAIPLYVRGRTTPRALALHHSVVDAQEQTYKLLAGHGLLRVRKIP